jgi:hypothetical protein
MKLDVYKCMSCALILSLFVVIRETSAMDKMTNNENNIIFILTFVVEFYVKVYNYVVKISHFSPHYSQN